MATCSASLGNPQSSDLQCLELQYEKYRKMCWVSAPDHGTLRALLRAMLAPNRSKNSITPQGRSVRSLAPGLFKSYIFRLKAALRIVQNYAFLGWLRKQLDSHQLQSGPRPRSLHGPDCQHLFNPPKWTSTIRHSAVEWVTACVLVEETPLPFRPFWFEKPQGWQRSRIWFVSPWT